LLSQSGKLFDVGEEKRIGTQVLRRPVELATQRGHPSDVGLDITTVGLAAERDLFLRGFFNPRL
jgi:hypothetical protein